VTNEYEGDDIVQKVNGAEVVRFKKTENDAGVIYMPQRPPGI
jgi:formylmethanofuran dehydrogenase subunit D